MKKLTILFLVLVTFSCNNQPDNDTTDNSIDTTSQIETLNTENEAKLDTTTTNFSQDFTYQAADNRTDQPSDNFMGFSSFYREFDKPEQTFTLDANEDKTITCKEGTKITVKSNSFVTESGNTVTGDIKLLIKEFYKTSDMLLANLTTTSNNNILETGGMLHIEAFFNGEKCQLKKESTIEIAFPTKDKKDDMQLFSGSWTSDKINWVLQENKINDVKETTVFTIVDTMPEFPGGQEKFNEYITGNVRYPRAAIENGIQGKVYIGFIVNENGEIENARVIRGVDSLLDQAAISVVEQMPKWTPGKQGGEFVKVNMIIPVKFSIHGESSKTANIEYAKEFEKQINDDNLSQAKISEVRRYLFSSSKLGWINCDRFYKDNSPKVDYFVNIGKSKQIDIKIVFIDINSILSGSIKGDKYNFDNIPAEHSVKLVALKYENDQYYLAIKKTKTSKDGEPPLEFKPVTMARLKTEMEKLNRI